jgi:hypothetical protein
MIAEETHPKKKAMHPNFGDPGCPWRMCSTWPSTLSPGRPGFTTGGRRKSRGTLSGGFRSKVTQKGNKIPSRPSFVYDAHQLQSRSTDELSRVFGAVP